MLLQLREDEIKAKQNKQNKKQQVQTKPSWFNE